MTCRTLGVGSMEILSVMHFLNDLEGVLQETYTTVQKELARFDKRMMASTLFLCVKEKLL